MKCLRRLYDAQVIAADGDVALIFYHTHTFCHGDGRYGASLRYGLLVAALNQRRCYQRPGTVVHKYDGIAGNSFEAILHTVKTGFAACNDGEVYPFRERLQYDLG